MKSCLVTGAQGYVGGAVSSGLRAAGWRVIPLGRRPEADGVRFELGSSPDPHLLKGADCLVHCAYDFSPRDPRDARAVNVEGSRMLFSAARSAGVRRILVVSSMSAFSGCRSIYGNVKLEMEALAEDFGADVIRPGLVYGPEAGGVFGQLMRIARSSRIVPLIDHGSHVQYLVHETDLGRVVSDWAGETFAWPKEPLIVAHSAPLTMKAIVSRLAALAGTRPRYFSVPGFAVYAGLRTAEAFGLQLNFRSDSLVGLMHPNPRPDFAPLQALGVTVRPFPEGLKP